MKLSIKQKAILSIGIVALSYVLLNVAVRFMNAGFGPFTQVYLRIGLGFILTFLIFKKEIQLAKFLKISRRDWLLLFIIGTAGYGLAVDCITLGVLHTKLINVSVLSSTTPFFVYLFSILVLQKKYRYLLSLFLLITFYGVFVIATKSLLPQLSNFGIGDVYVLLFAIGFSGYVLGRKYLSSRLNNSEIAVIILLIAFLSSFATSLIVGEPMRVEGFFNPVAVSGLAVSGVLIVIATKLQNFGFEHLNSVAASQLMLLQNVFAPVLGFLLFGEIFLPVEFVGTLVVLAGVWLYIRQGTRN